MKEVALALFFFLTVGGETQQLATFDTASVEGVVTEAATGRPIVDVRVWTDRSPAGEFTTTDANGRFAINRVPAGTRAIRVGKKGYALAKSVGIKPPGLAATAALVTVEPGKAVQGVVIQLVAEGIISGRILPEGLAANSLSVRLARNTYTSNGERNLVAAGNVQVSTQLDNWGEYRFEGLQPGEYYIYFNSTTLSVANAETIPFMYYPDALDLATATRFLITPGTRLRLDDLKRTLSLRTPKVLFHLINATGNSDGKGCRSISWNPGAIEGDVGQNQATVCGPPTLNYLNIGMFSPGRHDVFVGWRGAEPNDAEPVEGALVSFEVRDSDLDVDVVISHARISGKIVIEQPDGAIVPAAGLQFKLSTKRAGPAFSITTKPDGSFVRERMGAGEYVVEFSDLPFGAYITDSADELTVRSTDVEVNKMISLRGGILEGTVARADGSKAAAAVVVLTNGSRHHVISTTLDGAFVIQGIAPGSYRLFAWNQLEGAAYKNSEFMGNYESRGKPVVIEKGQRLTIQTTLLED